MTDQTNDLAAWQKLALVLIAVFCAWFIVTFSPKRQPETPEQFAMAARDCFASGHDTYSIQDGCR